MPTPHSITDLLLHLNVYLNAFATHHPLGVYGVLMSIVFLETGLVVWPFLPGDSLLFAVGALAATPGSPIHLPLVIALLCLAANCGDLTNYFLGRTLGPKVFSGERSFLFSRKYIADAQAFYERHGRKTIVIARFVPIIRTFAPFVAGIGNMAFSRFISFSIAGGVFWVTAVTLAGYQFGKIPWVDKHFEIVVLAIVAISLIPIVVHAIQSRRKVAMPGFEPIVPNP